jgi:hypothetical protein
MADIYLTPFVKALDYLSKKYHIRHIRISGYNSRANEHTSMFDRHYTRQRQETHRSGPVPLTQCFGQIALQFKDEWVAHHISQLQEPTPFFPSISPKPHTSFLPQIPFYLPPTSSQDVLLHSRNEDTISQTSTQRFSKPDFKQPLDSKMITKIQFETSIRAW